MEKDKKKNDFDHIDNLFKNMKDMDIVSLQQIRNELLKEKVKTTNMKNNNKRIIECNR
jgi:hypothetical protein